MRTRERDAIGIETISGIVSQTGVISSGTGFNVTKGATGVFTLSFPSLRAILNPIINLYNYGGLATGAITQPNTLTVNSWAISGGTAVAADAPFSFIVRGLPR